MRREAPTEPCGKCEARAGDVGFCAVQTAAWWSQCLTDLRAGKHAKGCGCEHTVLSYTPDITDETHERGEWNYGEKANACTEIVRCALEMEGYDVE